MSDRDIYKDKDHLLRIARGDESAFTEFFHHHSGNIYSTALRLTNSSELAEEIMQDVFLKIWVKRQLLESVNDAEAYIHTIARRAAYRALRLLAKQKGLLPELAGNSQSDVHMSGEHIFQLKQYETFIRKTIDRLPPKQRETYLLIREKGLKRDEVAELLGVSPETVKYNLDEATRKVRSAFMAAHGDILPVLALFFPSIENIF